MFRGNLAKMSVRFGNPVAYTLTADHNPDMSLSISDFVGKPITLRFTGNIACTNCAKPLKKTYGEGYCYDCFISAAGNAPCIINPELCEAHLGKGRDPEWEEAHHNQPHTVYLALSSEVKVGVTRDTNIPSRWIDQGAVRAIRLAEVPYRRLAGEIEVFLKDYLTDKTSWQKMLKGETADLDLVAEKERIGNLLPGPFQDYYSENDEVIEIHYPVLSYPSKVTSLTFDKQAIITGQLTGIKAQYLIFSDGRVLNIRRHTGYEVELE